FCGTVLNNDLFVLGKVLYSVFHVFYYLCGNRNKSTSCPYVFELRRCAFHHERTISESVTDRTARACLLVSNTNCSTDRSHMNGIMQGHGDTMSTHRSDQHRSDLIRTDLI